VRGVEESYRLYRRQSADNRGSFSQPKKRPKERIVAHLQADPRTTRILLSQWLG
jgi:hypothetical protein